jgi:acetolactate synthase-1/2/3 large subunit
LRIDLNIEFAAITRKDENSCKRIIIAEQGCIKTVARDVVAQLSESLAIPVTTNLKGKGSVGDGSGLSLGCLGVTSNGDAYRYITEHADLLIFLGAGFNERTSYLGDARLLENKKVAQLISIPNS